MTSVRLISEWLDTGGGFLRASNWVFAPAGLGTYEAAVQAVANPTLQFATNGIPSVGTATPGTTTYPFVQDVAVLVFQTVPGTQIQVVVPGPLQSIFGSGSLVVDPTVPAVASLIAAVIGTLGDAGGNAVTAYVSGVKSSRRTEQS